MGGMGAAIRILESVPLCSIFRKRTKDFILRLEIDYSWGGAARKKSTGGISLSPPLE